MALCNGLSLNGYVNRWSQKRIVTLNATKLAAVRLTVTATEGGVGLLRAVAAYGSAKCALPPPAPHPPCELEHGYHEEGQLLSQPIKGSTASACCEACRAVPGKTCVSFALSPAGECSLFKALGGGQKTVGWVSGSPIWG